MLRPFLAAADSQAAQKALEQLITVEASPRIREIVTYKLKNYDSRTRVADESADVQGEVMLQLITRLADLRRNPHSPAIFDFRGYVAVAAYRSCYDYLRRKYPHRYSLKQKLRRTVAREGGLDLWEGGAGQIICGLAGWRNDAGRRVMSAKRVRSFCEQDPPIAHLILQQRPVEGIELGDLVTALFKWTEQPIELDDLVAIIVEFQGSGEKGPPAISTEDAPPRALETIAAAESVPDQLSRREYLKKLWREIQQMAPGHSAALLLNLRDEHGESPIDLFLSTGTASFDAIASVLGMPEQELAGIWNRLPLDDASIAERLGLRRQQVINLRSAARERLARRMKSQGQAR